MLSLQVDTILLTFQISSTENGGLDVKEGENGVGFTNEGVVEVPIKDENTRIWFWLQEFNTTQSNAWLEYRFYINISLCWYWKIQAHAIYLLMSPFWIIENVND